MNVEPHHPAIIILGNARQGGAYVLRLTVERDIRLSFGRFRGGKAIAVPAGECVYAGSARGSLARRLVRHATRSGRNPPHPIRATLLTRFAAAQLGHGSLLPRAPKKLHWHIDYLLDRPAVHLTGVIAIRSATPLESAIARHLAGDPATFIIAPGLGASDAPGRTHLLGVNAPKAWWAALPEQLARLPAREERTP